MTVRLGRIGFEPRMHCISMHATRAEPNVAPPDNPIDTVPRLTGRATRETARHAARWAEERSRRALEEVLSSGAATEAQRLLGILRCELRMSSRQVAERMKCREKNISVWSTGAGNPTHENLAKLRALCESVPDDNNPPNL